MTMLTAKFGKYFSSNFFRAAVANKLYIQKVKKTHSKKTEIETPKPLSLREYLDNNFSSINFSTFQILLDPIITQFCCLKKCLYFQKSWQRDKLLQESDQRFNDELNIRKMLEKIRTTCDL